MYKVLLKAIEGELSVENLKQHSLGIYPHERTFCYRNFGKSTEYCLQAFEEAGLSRARRIALPADGETTFMDHVMPEAWDVDEASLEILEPEANPRVLADTRTDPMCVANRCPSTPRAGTVAEVLHEEDAAKQEDLRGTMVFSRRTSPSALRRRVLDKGAAGILYSHALATHEAPDNSYWINGWGFPGWYHTKEDKKILCFSLSPRMGLHLEGLLRRQPVKVRAKVRSRTYAGTIDTVTGVLPGEAKDEIVLLAHIYEPFVPDDAVGAAALIEMGRVLKELRRRGDLPPLRKSIRFLISQEQYGFAQFFEKKANRERVLCAVNLDGICYDTSMTGEPIELRFSPRSLPFFGDLLLADMVSHRLGSTPWKTKEGNLSDDTFLSDRTVGIPTNWLSTHPGKYHHNSADSFDRLVSWQTAQQIIPLVATYAGFLATAGNKEGAWLRDRMTRDMRIGVLQASKRLAEAVEAESLAPEEAAERMRFFLDWQEGRLRSLRQLAGGVATREAIEDVRTLGEEEADRLASQGSGDEPSKRAGRREALARNLVITRKRLGMPFSLARVPLAERVSHPSGSDAILSWADGKRSLHEILRREAREGAADLSDKRLSELLKYLALLEKYGYIELKHRGQLTREKLRTAIRKLGVRKGDRIIVHSSLSSMGYIEGGPETVCRAFMDVVTKEGVLMMPSFNHYQALTGDGPGFYDPTETPTVDGAVPEAFWRMKGVYRSLDPSHAMAAWGKNARDYVKDHHRVSTIGVGSPLHLLEQEGGKVILIDCPTANTFHHAVEMTNYVPCLGHRTEEYNVKLPSGRMVRCRTWGWRDSSCPINEGAHYLPEMEKRGLVRKGTIGNADVLVFSMADCRAVIEEFLAGEIAGYDGCAKCPVRPRVVEATVESDWDREAGAVRPDTTAYVGDFEAV